MLRLIIVPFKIINYVWHIIQLIIVKYATINRVWQDIQLLIVNCDFSVKTTIMGRFDLTGRHFENYYEVNHCSSLRLLWNKFYTNEFLMGLYFPRGLLSVCPWVREWYFPHFHSSTNNNASGIRHVQQCDLSEMFAKLFKQNEDLSKSFILK